MINRSRLVVEKFPLHAHATFLVLTPGQVSFPYGVVTTVRFDLSLLNHSFLLPMIGSCFLQFYRIAEILQTLYMVFHNLVFFSAIQIVMPSSCKASGFQNVIGHNQILWPTASMPFLPTSPTSCNIGAKVSVFHLCCSQHTGSISPLIFIAVGCLPLFFYRRSHYSETHSRHADKCLGWKDVHIAPISAKIKDDPCSSPECSQQLLSR